MIRRRKVLTAAVLSATVGFGAQSLFAQTGSSGSGGPVGPGPTGPAVPQPGPHTQPTIPGQPAPGLPQTSPMPGQPGTIPERAQQPRPNENMVVSAEQIRKAQDALKARGLNPGTDGKLDERTQQALRDFQKQNNLPATGVLDEKTADKLGIVRDSGSSISPGGRSGSTGATGSSGGMSSGSSGSSGATGSTGGSSSPSSGSSLK